MPLDPQLLKKLSVAPPEEAWKLVIQKSLEILSPSLPASPEVEAEVARRDREIGQLDLFLASSAWDLWKVFGAGGVVPRNADEIVHWWNKMPNGKALLILDGLSLRELPWIIEGASKHGFTVHQAAVHASELPGETNQFAQALGYNSRSQLQNNGGGGASRLQPAYTETIDMHWQDCEAIVPTEPNIVFWHHWPDSKVHALSGLGDGLEKLTKDAASELTDEAFWSFVGRLAQGRRLLITSDHGYAATGYFPDATREVGGYLKDTFSSGRSKLGSHEPGPFVPPVALSMHGPHGDCLMALGRQKWRNQGGYPTLTHCGLSLLEVLTPFVELSKA